MCNKIVHPLQNAPFMPLSTNQARKRLQIGADLTVHIITTAAIDNK